MEERALRSNSSQLYQKLIDELRTGPKTRKYLIRELSKYVPFEKALRKAERSRLQRWRKENPDAPLREAPPRRTEHDRATIVAIGTRGMIGEVILNAQSTGRVVIDKDPTASPKGGGGPAPNDIVRLRRPGETSPVLEAKREKRKLYNDRRTERRRQRREEEQRETESKAA